jgi:hypothetical protein
MCVYFRNPESRVVIVHEHIKLKMGFIARGDGVLLQKL